MPRITAEEISAAYSTAKAVMSGTISEAQGVKQLARRGMSTSSASDFIRNLRQMLSGAEYQRTLSIPAVKFYLRNIKADFGSAAYGNALQSVERHLAYYEALSTGHKQPGLRKVLDEYLAELGNDDLHELEIALGAEVKEALALSPAERRTRLQQAPKKPKRSIATVTVFARNPIVIAEVLLRANGACEGCSQGAPFLRRSDGSPYLEVHHKIRLADDGEDTVENAIALCPNCHRRSHYG